MNANNHEEGEGTESVEVALQKLLGDVIMTYEKLEDVNRLMALEAPHLRGFMAQNLFIKGDMQSCQSESSAAEMQTQNYPYTTKSKSGPQTRPSGPRPNVQALQFQSILSCSSCILSISCLSLNLAKISTLHSKV